MSAPPARILVIDDDAELRTLLLRYLGENGFDVRVAATTFDRTLDRRVQWMMAGIDGAVPGTEIVQYGSRSVDCEVD